MWRDVRLSLPHISLLITSHTQSAVEIKFMLSLLAAHVNGEWTKDGMIEL